MSRGQRLLPMMLAAATGVVSGVYIFRLPLQQENFDRETRAALESKSPTAEPTNNAPSVGATTNGDSKPEMDSSGRNSEKDVKSKPSHE
ncbi:hypothetical protein DL93DRAFT_2070676 [Clavulina sp. PMI_390]|nr:hypothetical protein DL93DRAFT_2070676 [Clavulina sp. PMI_390]